MIRVILDTNIWISLLLKTSEGSSIRQVIEVAFGNDVELLMPQELIQELQIAVEKSAYLKRRILKRHLDRLIEQFYAIAFIPPVVRQHDSFSRDPKDDYLISYSLLHSVDYLVTGDQDLLALHRVGKLQIVTPTRFLELLS